MTIILILMCLSLASAAQWHSNGTDGSHHKDWVLDQVVRILTGDAYEQVIRDACGIYDPETGESEYEWEVGIAP